MFADSSILETIASVASALCQYEVAGSPAPPAAPEAAEGVLKESAAGAEPAVVVSASSPTREDQGASLTQPAETVASAPAAAVADVAEGVVGEAGPLSPRPVAAAVAPQERVAPEGTTRVASPEIQEAEEDTGTTLLQGTASSEAQTLELACTPWPAAFESGDDAEDDEEVVACNTLERELAWACRAFDELILLATLVRFLTLTTCSFDFLAFSRSVAYSCLARGRPLRHQVGGEPAQLVSSTRSGPHWRCSLSWLGWRRP
jgi:hypothetical protein